MGLGYCDKLVSKMAILYSEINGFCETFDSVKITDTHCNLLTFINRLSLSLANLHALQE